MISGMRRMPPEQEDRPLDPSPHRYIPRAVSDEKSDFRMALQMAVTAILVIIGLALTTFTISAMVGIAILTFRWVTSWVF